jgi:hypothetical protein
MSSFQLKTPVTLMIFKRPETTGKVFEAIRQAKPPQLFVIADGARLGYADELEKCAAARAIIDRVDWKCEVVKDYADSNLGPGKRIASGLNWVFSQVEESIILEDDCLPHPTFFQFCDELLEKYREDTRITSISGQNVQLGRRRTEDSYYFSIYNHIWGWATWRRAWQHFDFDMKQWPEVKKQSLLSSILTDSQAIEYWHERFESTYDNPRAIWDHQWTLACWLQSGLCVIPTHNLISNIGFTSDGTNIKVTKGKFYNRYANTPTKAIEFPLKHSPFILSHRQADIFTQATLFKESWRTHFRKRFQKILSGFS